MLHRILVVDENRTSSLSLVHGLKRPEWTFEIAETGEDALDRCKNNHDFSVILMDMQQPGLDGFEITRRLKQYPTTQNTPVIFISAFGDDRDFQDQAYAAGAVDVLAKPVHVRGLEAKISVFCESHALRTVAAQPPTKPELATGGVSNRFVADMAHELRTPISGIAGLTDLLIDTDLNVEQQELAETLRTSADVLMRLVNDVLDYSKMEAGRLDLVPRSFDIFELMDSVSGILACQAQSRGLEFVLYVEPDVPRKLVGDATRLRQILVNLAGNAVKFTEQGEVVIHVSVETDSEVTDQQLRLRCEVSDTGIGIDAQAVDCLFDAYAQADASTGETYGGTGLGLTISRQLCRLMGGEISVESQVGQGSTFRFTATLQSSTTEPTDQWCPADEIRDLTVLVASPSQAVRRSCRALLERWGCRVSEARDRQDVSTVLDQTSAKGWPPLLALFDETLPGLASAHTQWCTFRGEDPAMRGGAVGLGALGRKTQTRIDGSERFDRWLAKPISGRALLTLLGEIYENEALGSAGSQGVTKVWDNFTLKQDPPLQILVAEDNVVNQSIIRRVLQKLGCDSVLVADGQQALVALETADFDLVLMDLNMPVMDGLQALFCIRGPESKVRNAQIPVILMTAQDDDHALADILAQGFDAYVPKPFKTVEMAKTIAASVLQLV